MMRCMYQPLPDAGRTAAWALQRNPEVNLSHRKVEIGKSTHLSFSRQQQRGQTMAAKGKKPPASSKKGGGKKSKKQPVVEDSTDDSDADDESSVYDSGDDGAYPDQHDNSDGEEEEYSSDEDDGDYESEEEGVDGESGSDDDGSEEEEDGEGFEEQGSSDEDEMEVLKRQARAVDRRGKNKTGKKEANDDDDSDDDGLEVLDSEGLGKAYENVPRTWKNSTASKTKRTAGGKTKKASSTSNGDNNDPATSQWMHTDDLSSDDEDADGTGNRIGRVPLHWYEDYDHIGYDAHGGKVIKQGGGVGGGGDMLDEAIRQSDNKASGKFVVQDALNAKDVELTPRQIELIRRIQSGAYAHPEHDGNAEYIDYFSGVNKEISGINSDRHEPKARFQPSKWEKLQVRRLLHRLKCGSINMDFLEGKVRDMNDLKKNDEVSDAPRLLWKGDEEDELALRKGPQHIAAPKAPPPGHAESYIPPDEYLPTEEDLKEWAEMDVKDRPHGLLVPKKHPNLRSVGSYAHSVRERFERCLDLYLCPRAMKRRLNIDPESLVPSIPRAADLRPFPTARAVRYETPVAEGEEPPMIRCLSVSPNGQFLASGASDGYVRLWEVQTSRLLRSWDVSSLVDGKTSGGGNDDEEEEKSESKASNEPKPVVALEWNPNGAHHCLLAAVGKCAVVIATGTGGSDDTDLNEALLSAAASCKGGGNTKNFKAAKAVSWTSVKQQTGTSTSKPISAFGGATGPICLLRTNKEVTYIRWHRKGDYFVTVCPKAAAAAVLIHQLSKASSQQPFGKAPKGGDVQCACFHPSKPFLFVATPQHVRVYHLIKQAMVKRLLSGCRWISSIDVHPSGDHVIIGSLDRRLVWFDLDLGDTPYKTLKYNERAIRSASFHNRYPLMASASDDGTVNVYHAMVYSDLMRNPLLVPVKVLRGHKVVKKFGVLASVFHPTQPWLFSAGADGNIHLYQDI